MTIDERLDNIARNLDILTKMHLDAEREREEAERERAENDRQYHTRFQKNEERLAQLMDGMSRIIRIIEIHEHRLDDLEGQG